MNFVITDTLKDFNVYSMKDNLELTSQDYTIYREISKLTGNTKIDSGFYRITLIRPEAIKEINPLVRGNVELREDVYVDDESLVTAMATRWGKMIGFVPTKVSLTKGVGGIRANWAHLRELLEMLALRSLI